jgi:hypothetical protein
MHVDVDMSGRIEETNKPTALGLANGISVSVAMTAAQKRRAIAALKKLRPEQDVNLLHLLVFTGLLYYLLRPVMEQLTLVTIDLEYPGHDAVIKNRVITLLRNAGISVEKDQLTIGQVGKKSPAHELAYAVYAKKQAADQVVTAEEIVALVRSK